jgi:hypothetical protein
MYTIEAQTNDPCDVYLENVNGNNGHVFTNRSATDIINHFGMGSTITTAQYIVIEGTLIIDVNIKFLNCPFIQFLDQNSGMALNTGSAVHLQIENCTLSAACNVMWKGITATTIQHEITISESLIRDMGSGILVAATNQFNFIDNIFENNSTAIELSNINALGNAGSTIDRNTFRKVPLPAMLPPGNILPTTGILHKDCRHTIEIGSSVPNGNTFSDLSTAISAAKVSPNASNLVIVGNSFQNIHGANEPPININAGNPLFYNNVIAGTAIAARNISGVATPTQQLAIIADQNVFENCHRAICGLRTSLHASSNELTDCNTGITLADQTDVAINVESNVITNSIIGIEILGNNFLGQVIAPCISVGAGAANTINITHNIINLPLALTMDATIGTDIYLGCAGIIVQDLGGSPSDHANIHYNSIYVEAEDGTGIIGRNLNRESSVSANLVLLKTTNTAPLMQGQGANAQLVGIDLANAEGTDVWFNFIGGTPQCFARNGSTGLLLFRDINSRFLCNNISSTRFGMQVQDNCTNMADLLFVNGNSFDFTNIPIAFSMGGTFGNLGSPGLSLHNLFYNTQLTIFGQPQKLFSFSSNTGALYYNFFTTPEHITSQMQSGGSLAGFAYTVAGNTFTPPNIYNACTGSWMYGHSIFAPSLFTIKNSWLGMVAANISIPSANYIPDLTRMVVIANEAQTYPYFTESLLETDEHALYKSMAEAPSSNLPNALTNFVTDYEASSTMALENFKLGVNTSASSIDDEYLTLYTSYINTKLNALASIETTSIMEANSKFVQEIQLLKLKRQSLTSTQQLSLLALANACPLTNGEAVFLAQAIIRSQQAGVVFNNTTACIAAAGQSKNGTNPILSEQQAINNFDFGTKTAGALVSCYPNPATDAIIIEIQSAKHEILDVTIYNQLGVAVKVANLPISGSMLSVNVAELALGIYTIKVNLTNNETAHSVFAKR